MRTNPEKNSNSRVSRWKPNSQASCAGFVAPSAQCHAAPHRSRLPLRSQRPDEGGLENSAASEARPCPPFLLFACYLQAGRSGPVAGAVGHPQASRPARRIPAREPPARIKVIKNEPANGEPGARSTRVRREGRGQSLRGRASQESRYQLFFSKRATPNGVSRTPRSQQFWKFLCRIGMSRERSFVFGNRL